MADKALKAIIDGFLDGHSKHYKIISNKITQYVYHQKSKEIDADDIISDVIHTLYDNLKNGRFRGDSISALNVYIFRIIKFKLGKIYRTKDRYQTLDEGYNTIAGTGRNPEESVSDKELADKIYEQIDEKCRELLRLKFACHWLDDEIAEYLNKSKNATSTAISRCLKKAQDLDFVKELCNKFSLISTNN